MLEMNQPHVAIGRSDAHHHNSRSEEDDDSYYCVISIRRPKEIGLFSLSPTHMINTIAP